MTSEDCARMIVARVEDHIRAALRDAYLEGYREGDLDRQRIERATIRTKQPSPRRKRNRAVVNAMERAGYEWDGHKWQGPTSPRRKRT